MALRPDFVAALVALARVFGRNPGDRREPENRDLRRRIAARSTTAIPAKP
jgi:hypothetical protein